MVLPTLGAIITNRQRVLAVQSALQAAVPTAIVQFGAGIGHAIDGVVRAFITAGQLLVATLRHSTWGQSTPLDTDSGYVLSSDLSGGDLTTLTVTPPSARSWVASPPTAPGTAPAANRREGECPHPTSFVQQTLSFHETCWRTSKLHPHCRRRANGLAPQTAPPKTVRGSPGSPEPHSVPVIQPRIAEGLKVGLDLRVGVQVRLDLIADLILGLAFEAV